MSLLRMRAHGALGVLAALGLLVSCGSAPTEPAENVTVREGALATVNGRGIYPEDVAVTRGAAGHEPASTRSSDSALPSIVRLELAAQKAEALGLDADPAYQSRLREAEAALEAVRRKELASLYYEKLGSGSATTEADARRYFLDNEERIGTEVHVLQILSKDRAQIESAREALARGESFDIVAGRRFAGLPDAVGRPWDLGWLRWSQVPEAWRPFVDDAAAGTVSDVVRGEGGRSWILMLVDRRQNPDLDFATVEPVIRGLLDGERRSRARAEAEAALQADAVVHFLGSTHADVEARPGP